MKLKGMYIFYGGSLSDISKDSSFEKHIKMTEEAPIFKEKSHVNSSLFLRFLIKSSYFSLFLRIKALQMRKM